MIALPHSNTTNFLNSSNTSGLPAACDYASMYCDNTACIMASSQERDEKQSANDLTEVVATNAKTACSKNLALKEQALLAFKQAYAPSQSMEAISKYFKSSDIRDRISERNAFNLACDRDLSVRGGSKAFWEAVIKWCEVYPCSQTNTSN
ncbi:hypothetical protein [Nostoc sp.]|uniref:hypothetical protein n=1 Tax=Nostoc sp. TaxID=1180 RepID=UPI002FFBA12F